MKLQVEIVKIKDKQRKLERIVVKFEDETKKCRIEMDKVKQSMLDAPLVSKFIYQRTFWGMF